MEELLALSGELGEAVALAGGLLLCLLPNAGEHLAELLPHELDVFAREANLRVRPLDGPLDELDRHVGLLAAGASHAGDAEEVGVGAAVPLRVDEAHPRAAASAEERAAIRSVYGQWFPQFVRIDKEWARRLAPRVFPHQPELGVYFDAAWSAYIVFNRAFTDVFEVLRGAYALAVERLEEGSGRTPFAGDPRERLGDHLLTYRILGATSGGEDLFATFWQAAAPDLRMQVLTHAGWSLEKTPELDPDVRDRLTATWEWILDEASSGEAAPPAGFGAWLATAALEGGWLLRQARAVLERGIHLEPEFVVYGALPRLAGEHPREVVEVLRRMVLTDAEGWSLHGSTDEVREALRIALAVEDPETQRRAEALVHLLGARGMTMFRDLVSDG